MNFNESNKYLTPWQNMTWYLVATHLSAITEVRRFLWLATRLHTWRDFVPLLFANPLQVIQVSRLTFGNSNLQLPQLIFYGMKVWRTRRVELMSQSWICVSSDHNTFTQFSSQSLANFRRPVHVLSWAGGASFWPFNIWFWWDRTNFIKKIIIRKKEEQRKRKEEKNKETYIIQWMGTKSTRSLHTKIKYYLWVPC